MEKWKSEIEDILGKVDWEGAQGWQELLPQMMKLLVTLCVAPIAVVSPEGREELRKMLVEGGVPPEKIEQAILWIIQNTTRPLGGGR